jgi:hypothetical protein
MQFTLAVAPQPLNKTKIEKRTKRALFMQIILHVFCKHLLLELSGLKVFIPATPLPIPIHRRELAAKTSTIM